MYAKLRARVGNNIEISASVGESVASICMSQSIPILVLLGLQSNVSKNRGNDAALHAFRDRCRRISRFFGWLWAWAGYHSNANSGELCGEADDPRRLTASTVGCTLVQSADARRAAPKI